MTKALFGFLAMVVLVCLLSAAAPAQQGQAGLTVTVNTHGQPMSDVQVVLVLANKNKVASATTASDGSATLNALDIANMGKVQLDVVVEQGCPDGKTYVTVTVHDQQPDDKGCKKRKKIFVFWWTGSGYKHLIVDVDLETAQVVPSSAGSTGPTSNSTPPPHLIWVQIGGGVGLKKFSNANTCKALFVILPDATCSGGDKSVAGGIEGTLGITPYFGFGATYTRTGRITRNGDTSTLSEHSTLGAQFETITGQLFLPIKLITLSAEGGAAFSQIRETEVQSGTSGGSTTSVTTNFHNNVTGPEIGARIQIRITNHIGAQVHYMYVRAENKPTLNEHNNVALFGIVVTLR
jgi:hypothetical protein